MRQAGTMRMILAFLALLVTTINIQAEELAATRDPAEFFFSQSFGDLPEELADAQKAGKIGLLLFFEQDECAYCEFMKSKVLNQRSVQDWYSKRFLAIAIDIRGDVAIKDFDGITLPSKIFAEQRKAIMTPVITFIDLDGTEVFRKWGMVSTPEEFLLMGLYIEEKRYQDLTFADFAQARGRDLDPKIFLTPLDGQE